MIPPQRTQRARRGGNDRPPGLEVPSTRSTGKRGLLPVPELVGVCVRALGALPTVAGGGRHQRSRHLGSDGSPSRAITRAGSPASNARGSAHSLATRPCRGRGSFFLCFVLCGLCALCG